MPYNDYLQLSLKFMDALNMAYDLVAVARVLILGRGTSKVFQFQASSDVQSGKPF